MACFQGKCYFQGDLKDEAEVTKRTRGRFGRRSSSVTMPSGSMEQRQIEVNSFEHDDRDERRSPNRFYASLESKRGYNESTDCTFSPTDPPPPDFTTYEPDYEPPFIEIPKANVPPPKTNIPQNPVAKNPGKPNIVNNNPGKPNIVNNNPGKPNIVNTNVPPPTGNVVLTRQPDVPPPTGNVVLTRQPDVPPPTGNVVLTRQPDDEEEIPFQPRQDGDYIPFEEVPANTSERSGGKVRANSSNSNGKVVTTNGNTNSWGDDTARNVRKNSGTTVPQDSIDPFNGLTRRQFCNNPENRDNELCASKYFVDDDCSSQFGTDYDAASKNELCGDWGRSRMPAIPAKVNSSPVVDPGLPSEVPPQLNTVQAGPVEQVIPATGITTRGRKFARPGSVVFGPRTYGAPTQATFIDPGCDTNRYNQPTNVLDWRTPSTPAPGFTRPSGMIAGNPSPGNNYSPDKLPLVLRPSGATERELEIREWHLKSEDCIYKFGQLSEEAQRRIVRQFPTNRGGILALLRFRSGEGERLCSQVQQFWLMENPSHIYSEEQVLYSPSAGIPFWNDEGAVREFDTAEAARAAGFTRDRKPGVDQPTPHRGPSAGQVAGSVVGDLSQVAGQAIQYLNAEQQRALQTQLSQVDAQTQIQLARMRSGDEATRAQATQQLAMLENQRVQIANSLRQQELSATRQMQQDANTTTLQTVTVLAGAGVLMAGIIGGIYYASKK